MMCFWVTPPEGSSAEISGQNKRYIAFACWLLLAIAMLGLKRIFVNIFHTSKVSCVLMELSDLKLALAIIKLASS